MRFSVELLLENEMIAKDKNRIILSILKNCFNKYSQEYYKRLYEDQDNRVKNFTFSLYLGNCEFLKEEIAVPSKKIILNFSAYNNDDGIMFFNSLLNSKGRKISIKNNLITIGKINLAQEKIMYNKQVIFKTMSPIVVKEHKGENKKTWYHSLNSKEGQAMFIKNLKHQLQDMFGEKVVMDFENLKVEISKDCKVVKVKNYGIEVHSNIGKIKISGQPYILDYLYKAGIGSKRGSGFGMVDIV